MSDKLSPLALLVAENFTPEQLKTELNRRSLREANLVEVRPIADPDKPDAHQVWIVNGLQSFMVGHALDTKEQSVWYADRLLQAIAQVATRVLHA